MVICPQCGAYNHEDAVWCVKCGMTRKPSAVSGDAPDVGIPVLPAQSLAPEQPVAYQQSGPCQQGCPPAYPLRDDLAHANWTLTYRHIVLSDEQ